MSGDDDSSISQILVHSGERLINELSNFSLWGQLEVHIVILWIVINRVAGFKCIFSF